MVKIDAGGEIDRVSGMEMESSALMLELRAALIRSCDLSRLMFISRYSEKSIRRLGIAKLGIWLLMGPSEGKP